MRGIARMWHSPAWGSAHRQISSRPYRTSTSTLVARELRHVEGRSIVRHWQIWAFGRRLTF
ncbi:hypothetical protein FOVG_19464 [Fusarium oxysporum f. sp. pisi HDV247]|uniref:Uncharacterized protein n=1 Tax=Fusarium oxysporum f. sp. pisi HDV247 TaxID=1080344 RepID=W9NM67_FUSOX|nr:hypothetical protein FOVG_19464 [Fusarium oxysporum f. sp. pisi HDV247]